MKKYRADNWIFASKEFRADCEMKNQGLDFCGMGAKIRMMLQSELSALL